jgi:hypothetical protein
VAQFFHAFDVDSLTGWTADRWATGTTWSVVDDELRETGASSEGLSYDAADSAADVELYFETKFSTRPSTSGNARSAFVRGAGASAATSTFYFVGFRESSFRVMRMDSGTSVTVGSLAGTYSSEVWYAIRFRINGSSLKARIWVAGDAEPGTWDIDSTDSTYSAAGWNGATIANFSTNAAWRKFGFGTGGDTAPSAPISAAASFPPLRRARAFAHMLVR